MWSSMKSCKAVQRTDMNCVDHSVIMAIVRRVHKRGEVRIVRCLFLPDCLKHPRTLESGARLGFRNAFACSVGASGTRRMFRHHFSRKWWIVHFEPHWIEPSSQKGNEDGDDESDERVFHQARRLVYSAQSRTLTIQLAVLLCNINPRSRQMAQ